jgi:hypothetical protein
VAAVGVSVPRLDGHLGHVSDELTAARDADSFRIRAAERVDDTTVATVATVDGEVAGFVMIVGDELEPVYVDATLTSGR